MLGGMCLSLPATIVYDDKPDMFLSGIRTIGVEIASLYREDGKRPQSAQRQQKEQIAAIKEAEAFDKANPIGNIQAKEVLIQKIVRLAEDIVDRQNNGQIPKTLFTHIPQLSSVHLCTHYFPSFQMGAHWIIFLICEKMRTGKNSARFRI